MVIIAVGVLACSADASMPSKRILYLNSYQNGYAWSDGILDGIRTELSREIENMDLQVEYMDLKKHFDSKILGMLHDYYNYKFGNDTFHVVITSDNDAFEFALKYRETLFKGVPIVFCGLNNYDPAMLAGHTGITGIEESVDFRENLEIALSLHPHAGQMVVIGNSTKTSLAIIREIRETIIKESIDFNVSFITGFKTGDLKAGKKSFLANISDNSLIYIVPTHETSGGEFYTPEAISTLV